MSLSLIRTYTFEAAHVLPQVPAGHKCGGVHGHSYALDVYVRGELDRKAGWIMDFADIDDRIVPLVKRLDHTLINDTINNPTAENIVLWLLHEIETLGFTWTYTRPGVWKLALRETERGAVSYEWPWVGFDDKYAQSLAILPETTR